MTYLHLFSTLVQWMNNAGATDVQVSGFIAKWLRLRSFDPLPCPQCQMLDEPGYLSAHAIEGKVIRVRCSHCGDEFAARH